jgi:hypothetical protein
MCKDASILKCSCCAGLRLQQWCSSNPQLACILLDKAMRASYDSARCHNCKHSRFQADDTAIVQEAGNFRFELSPGSHLNPPTGPTISKLPNRCSCAMQSYQPCRLARAFWLRWGGVGAPFVEAAHKCEPKRRQQRTSVMLHPAFLSAGGEWAEASFHTPSESLDCCLPPGTDAAAAAAPRSKRRRTGAGGISKVQCPRQA